MARKKAVAKKPATKAKPRSAAPRARPTGRKASKAPAKRSTRAVRRSIESANDFAYSAEAAPARETRLSDYMSPAARLPRTEARQGSSTTFKVGVVLGLVVLVLAGIWFFAPTVAL